MILFRDVVDVNNDYGNLELHKVLLSVMKDIDSVCRENGINYYLHAGTLLGAVNHGGFIPWDDDVDISMLRDDYERFLGIMSDRFADRYFVQNYRTDTLHKNNRTVIRVLGTELVYGDGMNGEKRCEIGVDIVPLDSAPNSKFLRRCHEWVIRVLDVAIQIKNGDIIPKSIFTRCISVISKADRMKLFRFMDRISMMFNGKPTEKIGLLTYTWKGPWNKLSPYENELCHRALYEKPIDVKFEDAIFMTISDPDEDLTRRYGDKYSEPYPEEKRVTKHGIRSYVISEDVKKRVGI